MTGSPAASDEWTGQEGGRVWDGTLSASFVRPVPLSASPLLLALVVRASSLMIVRARSLLPGFFCQGCFTNWGKTTAAFSFCHCSVQCAAVGVCSRQWGAPLLYKRKWCTLPSALFGSFCLCVLSLCIRHRRKPSAQLRLSLSSSKSTKLQLVKTEEWQLIDNLSFFLCSMFFENRSNSSGL